jgi:PAS domain-containing protein
MAIEVFNGTSIPREMATAGFEYLWTKWRTLSATNSLTLHRLIDESNEQLYERCHYMMPDGDDFAYVYVGRAMQNFIKRTPKGMLLMREDSTMAKDFAEIYRRVVRDMTPVFIRFTGVRSPSGTLWQQIIMPVGISDNTVMLVCYTELISHQLEIYEHLFRTAPDAIVVASPIANDAGHVTDGWILMMNDRARDMLNFQGLVGNRRLSELSQFNGIDLWGRIYAPRSAVTTTVMAARDFDIEILRFPHVFGIRLRPKSAMDEATLAPHLETRNFVSP